MPDVRWSTKPHEIIAAAKEAAKKSKNGHGLTALEHAFWQAKHNDQRQHHVNFEAINQLEDNNE